MAALVPAVTLVLTRGLVDALVLIVVVAVLAGMYTLRRSARAEVLYRRRAAPPEPAGAQEPTDSAAARPGRASATGTERHDLYRRGAGRRGRRPRLPGI